jgi:hypothetical protein
MRAGETLAGRMLLACCTFSIACMAPAYVSVRYSERLAEAGIEASVGSLGYSCA